jgi:hypothetical protein
METSTAQAIHELATTGRLTDESTEAVHKALGLHVDEDSGLVVADDKAEAKADDIDKVDAKVKATSGKGSGR